MDIIKVRNTGLKVWTMAHFAERPLKSYMHHESKLSTQEREVCFNCPYADCKKGYCDIIKDFRQQWHIKNKN